MAKDETEQWKQALKSAMAKVPKSMATCSIQTARAYKSAIAEAHKALASTRVTASKPSGLVNKLQQF